MNRMSQDFLSSSEMGSAVAVPRAAKKEQIVKVNGEACQSLAAFIRGQAIPIDSEATSLPGFSRAEIGNFYLFLVAICHQTSPFGKAPLEGMVRGAHKIGWDYLSAKLEGVFQARPTLFLPRSWTKLTGEDLADCFHDDQFGSRLTEPDDRAALLQDLGRVMINHSWEWAEDLYHLSGGRVASSHPNLIELLSKFNAYRDPVRKKSYFFLSLMRNAGMWNYIDDDRLGPPVDYHETRGHLRLGTVTVTKRALREKLFSGRRVTEAEDIAIRQAVHDAIMLISDLSGLKNPSQLHYLFWNVFRSCCSRESPHCVGCPPDCSLPDRYVALAIRPDRGRSCPFSSICASQCATSHKMYFEHRFETDYY